MVRLGAGRARRPQAHTRPHRWRRCRRSRSSSASPGRTRSTRSWRPRPAPPAKPRTAARSSPPSSSRPASAPRIITGTEEARLIHLAAVYGVDTPNAAVVIDIGGGSVEITLGSGREVKFARSFKLGVIRLTERFVSSDPISRRDERKMLKFIGEQVDRYIGHVVKEGFDRVIGTSGTILSLGTVATAMEPGHAAGGSPQPARQREEPEAPAQVGDASLARGAAGAARARSTPRRPGDGWRRAARRDHRQAGRQRRSRSAISRCARAWSSTTSTATARRSPGWIATPTSAADRRWSWPSAATGKAIMPSRWRGWR